MIEELPKITIEEDLLQGFSDESEGAHCIGFNKIYKNVEEKLRTANHSRKYVEFQMNSLKNRWAFWLDSMSEHISMVNIELMMHWVIFSF